MLRYKNRKKKEKEVSPKRLIAPRCDSEGTCIYRQRLCVCGCGNMCGCGNVCGCGGVCGYSGWRDFLFDGC